MRLEPHHERPLQLLRLAEAAAPHCWEQLDSFRETRGNAVPDWPRWCYLPIAAGFSVATNGASPEDFLFDRSLQHRGAGLGPPLVALAAWRATQGVWEFDPSLYAALWETPIEGKLPVELLYRLPEWAPYLVLKDVQWGGRVVHGVIPWLEWDANGGAPELRLLLDVAGASHLGDVPALALHLDADTVDECLHRAADQAIRLAAPTSSLVQQAEIRAAYGSNVEMVRHLLALVLYLCSSEPDLTRRLPPAPASYRKPVLRPPQQPIVWPVGLRIGAALRTGDQRHNDDSSEPTGRSVRPHIRRAHWHCYWTGPRSEGKPGERLELRWIAPTAVGAGSPVATVREVRE